MRVSRLLANGPLTCSIWRGGAANADLEVDLLGRHISPFYFNRNGTRVVTALSIQNVSPPVPVALGFWDAAGVLTTIEGPAGFDRATLTAASTDTSLLGLQLLTSDFRSAAFLWSAESGFVDINQLLATLQLSLPGWPGENVINTITGISDDGQTIVGQLYGGVPYVLTIPTPSAGVLLGGVLLIATRRRRTE